MVVMVYCTRGVVAPCRAQNMILSSRRVCGLLVRNRFQSSSVCLYKRFLSSDREQREESKSVGFFKSTGNVLSRIFPGTYERRLLGAGLVLCFGTAGITLYMPNLMYGFRSFLF